MTGSNVLYALRCCVHETFRQAAASKLFWVMLAVTGLCAVFCLGVSVEGGVVRAEDALFTPSGVELAGPNSEPGRLSLLFGAFRVDVARSGEDAIHMIHVILGTWVAGAIGLLLTLVWTAGFFPEALHPSAATVLLAKPAPRGLFLMGKYLGVVSIVAAQSALFFAVTWLALGCRTGQWSAGYLLGCPLLVLQFAGLFAFSVLLGVCTRSTLACVLGVVLFWALCLGINYGHHSVVGLSALDPRAAVSPLTGFLVGTCYWVLPKPVDLLVLLENALRANNQQATLSGMQEFQAVRDAGGLDPFLSLLTAGLFIGGMLWLAGRQLKRTDY